MKDLRNLKKPINIVYLVQLVLFGLVITGVLPREVSILMVVGLAIYFLFASIEDAAIFFVMSIPLFIAIPITADFDNFNTWRILSVILFFKLLHVTGLKYFLKINEYSRYAKLLLALLVLAVLSVIPAVDKASAITRIIYFVNLSLPGIVVYCLFGGPTSKHEFGERLIKSITVPTIIVTVVGFIQLASTYFIDIYQFMRIWGEGIQMRQFGVLWSEIAVKLGNTWFAYYGEQLSLRVFSLFPDSHSFPQFVLLGLPALFAISLLRITNYPLRPPRIGETGQGFSEASELRITNLMTMIRTRVSMNIVWVALALLIAILSGTRGIWAASVGVVIIAGCTIFWQKKTSADIYHKNI